MRQAGRLKAALFALWLWRSIGTWLVQYDGHDGHWLARCGGENSGIRMHIDSHIWPILRARRLTGQWCICRAPHLRAAAVV